MESAYTKNKPNDDTGDAGKIHNQLQNMRKHNAKKG
jgi:hypothetical protein